jgi:hypothetical protein
MHPPGFEPGLADPKSAVISISLRVLKKSVALAGRVTGNSLTLFCCEEKKNAMNRGKRKLDP